MFEELGYNRHWNKTLNFIQYVKVYEENGCISRIKTIYFDITGKMVNTWDNADMYIDIPTFKAIHQQMKELGWIDE